MAFDGIIFTDVNGPVWSRALGAYRLAHELRKLGFQIKVIDCLTDFSDEELESVAQNFISNETLFIGFSTTFLFNREPIAEFFRKNRKENFLAAKKIISFCRNKFPKIKVLVGGANSNSYLPLKADLYVEGYCENLIADIVKFISSDTQQLPLHLRSNNLTFSLDKIETCYDTSDHIFKNETLVLETSRGCRFRCKFCNYPLNGRKTNTYLKDELSLTKELIHNYEEHGTTHYFLSDDTFNESIEKMRSLHRVFTTLPFKINFFAYLRLDLMHKYPEMQDLLLEMGLRSAFFGIESLHDKTAKAIGKGLGRVNTLAKLQELRQKWGKQVFITTSYILGLPYETPESIETWLPLLVDKNFPSDYVNVFPLTISFGKKPVWVSEIAQNAESFNYKVENGPMGEYWKNEHLDSDWCKNQVQNFYQSYWEINPNRTINGSTFTTLQGYGFSMQEVQNYLRSKDAQFLDRVARSVESRIKNYKELHLNLPKPLEV